MRKPERNEPCPCGEGRKFKMCCGGPNPTLVRVTFHVGVDEATGKRPGLLAINGVSLEQLEHVEDELLEGFTSLHEPAFGSPYLGIDLLTSAGKAAFLDFISERAVDVDSPDQVVMITIAFRNATGAIGVRAVDVKDITAVRWQDGAPIF